MKAGPFDRQFWVEDEIEYDHVVVPFGRNRADRITQARTAHEVTEADRASFEVVPTRAEERQLWDAYLAAIRRSVDAQAEVNRAHNEWLTYAERISRG